MGKGREGWGSVERMGNRNGWGSVEKMGNGRNEWGRVGTGG